MHAATYTVMFRSIPQATAVLLWLLGLRRRRFVAFRRNSATVTATAPSFAADHAVWLVAVGGCGFDVYVGGGRLVARGLGRAGRAAQQEHVVAVELAVAVGVEAHFHLVHHVLDVFGVELAVAVRVEGRDDLGRQPECARARAEPGHLRSGKEGGVMTAARGWGGEGRARARESERERGARALAAARTGVSQCIAARTRPDAAQTM